MSPIKNYTTKISPGKTVGEISELLAKAGASAIRTTYESGKVHGVAFAVPFRGDTLHFELPCNWRGVLTCLERDGVAPRFQTEEHARRVAWRIVKDWIDSQMALIDAGGAELAEIFFPFMIVDSSGQTAFGQFAERKAIEGDVIDGEVVEAR